MALAHAILVSLLDCPCSGYDLAKRFDRSVGFFWDASHQQIYRELAKLEAEGYLVAEKIDQEGRPNKKVYEVTPYGRQLLQEWIAQPAEISPVKDDLLVKLFGGHLVPKEIILKELEQHRQQHLARLAEYQSIQATFQEQPVRLPLEAEYQYLTLLNGLKYEESWLAWCEEAIARLTRSRPAS
ncbi:MAG: PadR family transcriptional regulator [Cyanobacteria bacterium Co-bin8]|nr:PadR family transcriptional regulator [Cyanobacteria bacterium Co-bin8]